MKLPKMTAGKSAQGLDGGTVFYFADGGMIEMHANAACQDEYNAMIKACGSTLAATIVAGGLGALFTGSAASAIGPGAGLVTACPYYAIKWGICKYKSSGQDSALANNLLG